MRILQEDTVGLCIDVQERLFPHIDERDFLERKLLTLLSGLQILAIPIIVTEQYPKGLGQTILAVQELMSPFSTLEKSCFSCADDSEIQLTIEGYKKNSILIFGIEAHVCVLQTVLDLRHKGMNVVVIADCVGSRNATDKAIALERMRGEGAMISSCESILFELCRVSGTAVFKQISQLIK